MSQFKRLASYLSSNPQGSLQVTLDFLGDVVPRDMGVNGHVKAELPVECQLCGGQMTYSVSANFRYAFIDSDGDEQGVTRDRDAVLIPENGLMKSVDLLEDELILGLPMSPRHSAQEPCEARAWLEAQAAQPQTKQRDERENPFAALRHLNQTS